MVPSAAQFCFSRAIDRVFGPLLGGAGRQVDYDPVKRLNLNAARVAWYSRNAGCAYRALFLPCGLHREAFANRDSALRSRRAKTSARFWLVSVFGFS